MACGHGEGAEAQLIDPVAVGAGAACTAATALGASEFVGPVVKTVAAMIELAPPFADTHARSGAYAV